MEKVFNNEQTVILLILVTIALTSFLSSKFITSAAQPIIELRWSKGKTILRGFHENIRNIKRKLQNE